MSFLHLRLRLLGGSSPWHSVPHHERLPISLACCVLEDHETVHSPWRVHIDVLCPLLPHRLNVRVRIARVCVVARAVRGTELKLGRHTHNVAGRDLLLVEVKWILCAVLDQLAPGGKGPLELAKACLVGGVFDMECAWLQF